MKGILAVIALLALGGYAMYQFGGYESFNPEEQGKQAKSAIKPGMTWTQVIAAAGENAKLKTKSIVKKTIDGETYEQETVSPAREFNKDQVADRLRTNGYKHGFILNYYFTDQIAFDVHFDGKGVVQDIADVATMADLLQTRKRDE